MADNLQLPVMAGGEVIKADDMTTYKIEGVKLVVGADGVDGGYVSDANPLPVESTSTVIGSVLPAGAATEDSLLDILAALAGALSVTGTVAVSNFPAGFLAAQSGAWTVAVNNFPATQPVSGTVAATQSGTWNVGTVASITNPVAVTGTFYQATQPVSIASSVPVTDNSGSLTVDAPVGTPAFVRLSDGTSPIATLPVSLASVPSHAVTNAGTFAVQVSSIAAGDNNIGNVDIVSMPAIPAGANVIGGVTQSGTWNVGTVTAVTGITNPVAVTDNNGSLTVDAPVGTPAFVRLSDGAAPISTLPVSLASVPSHAVTLPNVHFQDVAITGALTTTANNNVVLASAGTGTVDLLNGTAGNSFKTITLQITPAAGTVTAGAISFEGSNDGTNFFIVPLYDVTNPVAGSITTYSVVAGTSRMFSGPVPARYFRARISTGITGTTTGVVCETKLSTGTFVSSQAFITVAPSSNNIGDVDVLTQPARVRTTDAIAAALQTDALMNGLTALTPKFANIACAASGDNQIVAAVTSKKIRIIGLFLSASGAVNAYFRDDAGSPVNLIGDGTNKLTLTSASGFVLPPSPYGWQETTSGEGLQLNLSAAVGVAGSLIYVEV